jgi:endonuclease/exonuclease/phosphatase (EEP) superfamily protein YafD
MVVLRAVRRRLGRLREHAVVAHEVATGGPETFAAVVQTWRPHLAAAAFAGAALAARRPRARFAALPLAAVALVAARPAIERGTRRPGPAPGPHDVTVLSLNVRHGWADTGDLAALIAREAPDFVVLPEAGTDFRDKLMPLVDGLGYRSWVAAGPGLPDGDDVTLLAAERTGVRVRSATGLKLRHLEATGGILGGHTLYAVHLTAPMSRGRTARWRRELDLVGTWCRAPLAPIVAGDFNASFDHPPLQAALGGCRSAADGTGQGLVGTYPAALPRPLGIQIDHVLVPADAATTRFAVLDVAGTDHRAVLARIRLSDAG